MGYGGNLLITAAIRVISERTDSPVRLVGVPQPSDLLLGRLYDRSTDLSQDPVFAHNPRILFDLPRSKSRFVSFLDRKAMSLVSRVGLLRLYENSVFGLSRFFHRRPRFVYFNMSILSYARRELPGKMIWRSGGHIIDIALKDYGLMSTGQPADHQCELTFSDQEEATLPEKKKAWDIRSPYVVVEPHTSTEWFADLRAWNIDSWKELLARVSSPLRASSLQIVQLGVGGKESLKLNSADERESAFLDLSGKTSFREAAQLIRDCKLFVGTEGGLMHVANAVNAPAVILWGGVTLPEFAGYPNTHHVICHYVDCAPCGLKGGCPYGKKCMGSITVGEVEKAIQGKLLA